MENFPDESVGYCLKDREPATFWFDDRLSYERDCFVAIEGTLLGNKTGAEDRWPVTEATCLGLT